MKTININIPIELRSMDELEPSDRQLVEKAIKATDNSYSPYSNFRVGACVRLGDGTEVIGANQENAAYPVSLCAERTAIFAAQVQHPELPIDTIAIAARNTSGVLTAKPISPCGSCRQVMLEMEDRYKLPLRVLLYGTEGVYVIRTVKDLMPLSFAGDDMDA